MLRYFFEKTENDKNYLFAGLAISNYPEYQKHHGQYPVIFISLKNVKGTS